MLEFPRTALRTAGEGDPAHGAGRVGVYAGTIRLIFGLLGSSIGVQRALNFRWPDFYESEVHPQWVKLL